MVNLDIILIFIIYAYIITMILISDKLIKNPSLSRKFTHIMVGNLIFIIPFINSQNVAIFLIGIPFLIVTLIINPVSPIKIKNNLTSEGHSLGLVYYSISWIILLYFFFDNMIIIAIGMGALSYGDGFASIIGQKWGKNKYNLTGDIKSIQGSVGMFIATFIILILVVYFYKFLSFPIPSSSLILLAIVSIVATIFEAITPNGTDNLTVALSASLTYLFLSTLI